MVSILHYSVEFSPIIIRLLASDVQRSHMGQDNNDNDGVLGHILALKVKLRPVSQWLIERKGKCLAALELLAN